MDQAIKLPEAGMDGNQGGGGEPGIEQWPRREDVEMKVWGKKWGHTHLTYLVGCVGVVIDNTWRDPRTLGAKPVRLVRGIRHEIDAVVVLAHPFPRLFPRITLPEPVFFRRWIVPCLSVEPHLFREPFIRNALFGHPNSTLAVDTETLEPRASWVLPSLPKRRWDLASMPPSGGPHWGGGTP